MLFSLEFIEIVAIQFALYLQRHILAIAEITTKNINYFIILYFFQYALQQYICLSNLFSRKSKPKQNEYMKSSYIDRTYLIKQNETGLMQHYCWAWWWDVNFLYCTGTKLDEVIHNNMFWHGCLHLWFTSWGVKNGKSSCGENVDYARPRRNNINKKYHRIIFLYKVNSTLTFGKKNQSCLLNQIQ